MIVLGLNTMRDSSKQTLNDSGFTLVIELCAISITYYKGKIRIGSAIEI